MVKRRCVLTICLYLTMDNDFALFSTKKNSYEKKNVTLCTIGTCYIQLHIKYLLY